MQQNGPWMAAEIVASCTEAHEHLNLSGLDLEGPLPAGITKLTWLKSLNLSHNRLHIIPPEVACLTQLESLYIHNNRIKYIDDTIACLGSPRRLYAYKNRIRWVSPRLAELDHLTELKLHNNKLSQLPASIGQLRSLQALYVNQNELVDLPPELGLLSDLAVLMVHGNSLPDTMLTAATRGPRDLLTYLRSLLGESEALYEAKLILVGEGAVGKSSLVAALTGQPFIENRETTHGIEMCKLTLPHPENSQPMFLNVWDFGGQPVYRITHQFFYSKRALYLLLWSPRRGVESCDVEGWLKRIRLRVGDDATVLVISTHADTGGRVPRIDQEVLRRDYGAVIAGFHDIDSKTGRGIDALKSALASVGAMLPQMGSRLNVRWKAARDATIQTNDARLSYTSFTRICNRYDLDVRAARTLADLLHDLGYIVYYGDDEGLRDEMVLQPEWLTKAIGYVLEDPAANEAKGVVSHQHLRTVWRGDSRATRERYPDDLHPFFLRLMEKYDVSYRLEGGADSLVAQLVPDVRPALPWLPEDYTGRDKRGYQVRLICEMDEEPPGLIPWLIVRTHHFATKPRLHWQRGMFLQYAEHGAAVVEQRGRELHIAVRGAWPNYFVEILRYIVTKLIDDRWPGLAYTLSVPCPTTTRSMRECRGRFPLSTLQKLKAKYEDVPCLACSRESAVDTLLTGLTPPDMRTELHRIFRKLDGTAETLAKLHSEAAARFRLTLRAMNAETRECPHLFTLLPESGGPIGSTRYRLTLWCEMPGEQHPITTIGLGGSGEYVFDRANPWLVRIAPYAALVARTLRTALPLAGSAVELLSTDSPLRVLNTHIKAMDQVTKTLLSENLASARTSVSGGVVSEAEGSSLRELHSILVKLDPAMTWGGLRRTVAPTGDYLWLCPNHYSHFDPGVPILGETRLM